MLVVEGLQSAYGKSQVLFDVSMEIRDGEVVTLLGRNGMGKTTTVRTIMGLVAPLGGAVSFSGRTATGMTPERIARLGIGLVPEGRQVFPNLTVRENLVATAANRLGRPDPWTLDRVYALFPRLGERAEQSAATLSGGEQQMLAVARALMTNPSLLILDEATEGLAPTIRAEGPDGVVRDARRSGTRRRSRPGLRRALSRVSARPAQSMGAPQVARGTEPGGDRMARDGLRAVRARQAASRQKAQRLSHSKGPCRDRSGRSRPDGPRGGRRRSSGQRPAGSGSAARNSRAGSSPGRSIRRQPAG